MKYSVNLLRLMVIGSFIYFQIGLNAAITIEDFLGKEGEKHLKSLEALQANLADDGPYMKKINEWIKNPPTDKTTELPKEIEAALRIASNAVDYPGILNFCKTKIFNVTDTINDVTNNAALMKSINVIKNAK